MAGSGAGLDRLGPARFGALPERPLRLLPRWLGIALLILTAIACIANIASLQTLDQRLAGIGQQHRQRGSACRGGGQSCTAPTRRLCAVRAAACTAASM